MITNFIKTVYSYLNDAWKSFRSFAFYYSSRFFGKKKDTGTHLESEPQISNGQDTEKPADETAAGDFSDLFKSCGVRMEKSNSEEFKFIVTVSKPDGCSNLELVDRYNELKYVLLSARLLGLYVNDLNSEFMSRFGKTPFYFDQNGRPVSWKRKIYYNSVLDTFEFFELN